MEACFVRLQLFFAFAFASLAAVAAVAARSQRKRYAINEQIVFLNFENRAGPDSFECLMQRD